MDFIMFLIIGGVCFTQGYNAYNCEEQTKVFTKIKLPLKDVKEYNHFCGKLIYGYGIVALFLFFMMMVTTGWVDLIWIVLFLAEAYAMVKIYSKNELKFIRKND